MRATGRALRWGIDEGSPTPDFTILSETEDWIALDKPAHLLVHPILPTHLETLWDGLKCLLSYELVNGGQISISPASIARPAESFSSPSIPVRRGNWG